MYTSKIKPLKNKVIYSHTIWVKGVPQKLLNDDERARNNIFNLVNWSGVIMNEIRIAPSMSHIAITFQLETCVDDHQQRDDDAKIENFTSN